jgi:Na+/H+ antiporter NhaC
MTLVQRILTLNDTVAAMIGGMRAMFLAVVILVLAWSLGDVTEALGTGPYLSSLIQDSLPIRLLPVLVFLVAAAISFATGTSWGTMAILFPVVIPLAVAMGAGVGFDGGEHYSVLLGAISSVMGGSIFGDHCSPISDTTVMSSMASACDHVDHVRTQMPYALAVGAVGMIVGDIPTAYGVPPWISLVVGIALLYGLLRWVGRPVAESPAANDEASLVAV